MNHFNSPELIFFFSQVQRNGWNGGKRSSCSRTLPTLASPQLQVAVLGRSLALRGPQSTQLLEITCISLRGGRYGQMGYCPIHPVGLSQQDGFPFYGV